ncbi:uncharacterized protein LOC100680108 [Nasonia vitripennis]|uniref:Uncharacterized protein n=1 Tax=Nasonia vitripennis TaxID=7425 RepID=A0A7M7H4J4_NASVI|nr:uncharacterized protein LOC100680108 [Nasonia vitripennis]
MTWPCLLDTFYMMLHFEFLTGYRSQNLKEKIKNDVPTLLAYGTLKQLIDTNEITTEKEQYISAIKLIFKYLNEEFSNLFLTIPPNTDLSEVLLSENHPTILMIESVTENDADAGVTESECQYSLFMESKLVDKFDSFLDAVVVLHASYYMFNYLWPQKVPCFFGIFTNEVHQYIS